MKPGGNKILSPGDPKLTLLQQKDYDERVIFPCLDFPSIIEHIDAIHASSEQELETSINKFVSDIINAKVKVDAKNKNLVLPKFL